MVKELIGLHETIETINDSINKAGTQHDAMLLFAQTDKIYRQQRYYYTDVQPANKWISVDEALPDNGDEVLVWYEYFRYGEYNCMYQTYGLARYIQRYEMWSGEDLNGVAVKVLYWQPLPEPPNTTE